MNIDQKQHTADKLATEKKSNKYTVILNDRYVLYDTVILYDKTTRSESSVLVH